MTATASTFSPQAGLGKGGLRQPCRGGLSKHHNPPSPSLAVATVELFKGAGFMAVRLEHSDVFAPTVEPGKRGEIDHFSDASRRRMMDLLAKVDYSQVPFWLDLTYPDHFPANCEIWKSHLETLFKRLDRRFPWSSAIWKLEFQERKSGANAGKLAPHFHLLLWGVPWEFPFKAERGKDVKVCEVNASGMWQTEVFSGGDRVVLKLSGLDELKEWLRRQWFDIVASGDVRHFKAGTSAARLKSRQGAFSYASKKYIAKGEQVKALGVKPGRFWGVFNRKNLPLGERECLRVTKQQAVQLRRFIRRHRRANTKPENRRWLRKGSASDAEKGFTVKHYCNADFWLAALPRLIGPALPPRPRLQIPPFTLPTELQQNEFL